MQNPYIKDIKIKKGPFNSEDILICYNENGDEKVVDVNVVYKPTSAPGPVQDPKGAALFLAYTAKWECDLPIGETDTAAAVFGYLLSKGFASEEEMLKAIRAFGTIVQCDWAREMTSGFEDVSN